MAEDRHRTGVKARRRRAPRGAGDRLRDEILDAATTLLIRTGCAKAVSIRSVADRVGVTSPSIYLHFADKDALFDAVCARHFAKLDEQLRPAAESATTVEMLHALGMAYVRFALKTPVLYELATMAARGRHGDVDSLATSAVARLQTAIQTLIDEGVYPPRDAEKMALELWTVVHGVVALFIAPPYRPRGGFEEMASTTLRVMCCGQIASALGGRESPSALRSASSWRRMMLY
jgi:AcrR family transcriptional regulator